MKKIGKFIAALVIINFSAYSQIKTGENHNNHKSTSASIEQMEAFYQLQRNITDVQLAWNENNPTPTFLIGKLTSNGYLKEFSNVENAAKNFLNENKILFNIKSPAEEFTLLRAEVDNLGMTHAKLQQYYNGLRIIGSQLIIHFNKQGAISSTNGRYFPTPEISLSPLISEEKSKLIASKYLNGIKAKASELAIYINNDQPELAYEVKLPTKFAPKQRVIINAQNGDVLYKDSGIRYEGAETGSGLGLKGENRELNIYLWPDNNYYLIDITKPMFTAPVDSLFGVIATLDAKNDTSINPYQSAVFITDPNNDKNFDDDVSLAAAVDAHFYTGKTYDYYKTKFNRNSWNNLGGSLFSYVHYQNKFNNAFWNGVFMTYGDGDDSVFSGFAGAYDVIVHEITHGVTSSTADLEYQGQSGALNESYSDVMAAMADDANWLIGEDIYTPSINGDALRDMSDPHNGNQPAHMSEFFYWPYTDDWDWGGVHTNSGIPNKAAYLVASEIGREKTEQIYYRTLTNYLTPKSQFIDARNATLISADDLYGKGVEYNAVASAFDSVGITSNLPRTNELSYDDGFPEIVIYESEANWGLVNRLSAQGAGELKNVSFYYGGDNSTGNGSFSIKIYDDDGNKPGNLLFSSNPITPGVNYQGWFLINFSSVNVNINNNFYVGIFYDSTNQPLIGADTSTINGRAWEWDNANQEWINLDGNSYFPVSLLIRATVNTITGINQISNETPLNFSLSQNYPNPFNPETVIKFNIPEQQKVTLEVFNSLGEKVKTLVDEIKAAGYYQVKWNGTDINNNIIASGTYIYRLKAGGFLVSKKMIFLK